jgi:hypothetical protein
MTRWETVVRLCEQLRAGLLGGPPPGPAVGMRWERLVEASSHHYVTPALAWCLQDRTDIPPKFRDYFAAALALNRQRNESLTADLTRMVAALNAIGVEPLLLKGAARLVDGSYPEPALRFLGDLDVLVPADRLSAAAAALEPVGFAAAKSGPIVLTHHHLPMLIHRETGTGVELHWRLTRPQYDAIVSPDWLWQHARSFSLGTLRVHLPDATSSAAHNVLHDQINNANYDLSRVELRQLLDIATIRRWQENNIDWSEIDRRFCSVGMGQVLATYLEFAQSLFGQPMPPLSHAPRAGALTGFRRSVEWRASKLLAAIAINTFPDLCQRPRHILKLFSRRIWNQRFHATRSRLHHARW